MDRAPTKVLYLMDTYAHPRAGTEQQVLELVRNLDRSRFKPHIAVFRDSEYLRTGNEFECPVEVLGIGKIASASSMLRLYHYARKLRKDGFAIVHIFFNDASIVAPLFLKLGGLKTIISRRDLGFWYSAANRTILRVNRLFVDQVVANSRAVKASVRTNEGYKDDRVSVIYNGCRRAQAETISPGVIRRRLGITDDGPIVGIVANLRAIKRIGDLIQAFARVCDVHADAWLVIVGEGELENELRRLAHTLGIADRVVFAGQVRDVAPIVQEFAVGVLCSESEGFSNAILEYMDSGKPVVCTDVGGNTEMVANGFSGILVPPGHVAALADGIVRVLGDAQLAKMLGENARKTVAERYDLRQMVAAHEVLYARLTVER